MQLKVTPIYGSSTPPAPSSASSSSLDENSEPLEWVSSPGPSCTLVEYAGMKVLLNAGWDETLSNHQEAAASGSAAAATSADIPNTNNNMPILPNELPNVDAVLICDSTLSSLGGLPLYFGASKTDKFGRAPRSLHTTDEQINNQRTNPPFLATYPTVKMGQMTLYDHHASLSLDGQNPGYSLEDVDAVFGKDSFHTLKYSQTVYLPLDEDEYSYNTNNKKTKSNSNKTNKLLAITPYLSGHVVGGCFWVLQQLSDDTEVVLAPTYHHAKEKHLSGCTLHKFGLNADAFVTMAGGPRGLLGKLYQPPPPKMDQQQQQQQIVHYNRGKPILSPPTGHRSESELIEFIMQALRRDGNVLLPVDASGRVLELLLVLDRHWDRQRLGAAYNLCWVGPMSINTIEFARAQLEWMNPPLGAQFDSQRGLNPYRLKNVKICSSVSELESVVEKSGGNPTAVLASGASLDHGPARDLLLKWGDNPDNLVLLTNSSRCVPRGDVWSQRLREKQGSGVVVKEKQVAKEDVATAAGGEADDEGKQLVGAALAPSDVSSYTAASQLLYKWCAAKASGEEMADEIGVDTYVPHRAPLAGAELKAFLAAEEEERRMKKAEAEKKAMMQEIELARGQLRLGEDTDGVSGGGVDATTKGASSATTSTTGGSNVGAGGVSTKRPRKKSRFNQDLFIKFSKPVHMTFDVREEAIGLGQPDAVAKYGIGESMSRQGDVVEDDYGISVKAESFVDIVTGVDPSKFAGGSGRIGEEVARRGLGFGVDGKQIVTPGGGDADNLLNDAEDEGMNEKMLEIADLSSGKGIIRGRNGRQPIKVSVIPRRLEVLAEVAYVPLEGRVDARAARQQVRALQPRHLVVIGGSKSNSLLLGDALRSSGPSPANGDNNTVHIPVDGDTIQLTVGHAAYPVRLLDTPYLTASEKEAMEAEEKEIEPVEPFEAKIGECTVSLVDFVATGKKWAVDGSLVLAPRRQENSLKQPSLMLSAREVLLTDLRSEVIALGMKAEYSALSGYSQLVVNGKIFVRKDTASGKLGVEGPLCEDFFRVRSLVSSQFVTL